MAKDTAVTEDTVLQDLDAEQATLGGCLIDSEAAEIAFGILNPADFYREAHRLIFFAMQATTKRKQPIDLITVAAELRRHDQLEEVGGAEYLTALMNEVPTTGRMAVYAGIVHDRAVARAMITEHAEAIDMLSNSRSPVDVLEIMDSRSAAWHAVQRGELPFCDWQQLVEQHGRIEWLWENWIPRGMVTLLAGQTGVGKTACAMALANILTSAGTWPNGRPGPMVGQRIVFIETESRTKMLLDRMQRWGFDGFEVVEQTPSPDSPIVNIASRKHQEEIAGAIRRTDASLLVIDSLSAGHALDENSQDMKGLLLDLCRLAERENVAVLADHHLRKRRHDEREETTLDRLRGSSCIAQLAVVTLAIERPDRTSDDRALVQIKNNLTAEQRPVGFRITDSGVVWLPDAPSRPVEPTMAQMAENLLEAKLAQGSKPKAELIALAEEEGITERTLYRAADKLQVVRPKRGLWSLPSQQQLDTDDKDGDPFGEGAGA